MNRFFVYRVGKSFVKIPSMKSQPLKIGLTSKLCYAATWDNKAKSKTWEKFIKNRFPAAELAECELKLKN